MSIRKDDRNAQRLDKDEPLGAPRTTRPYLGRVVAIVWINPRLLGRKGRCVMVNRSDVEPLQFQINDGVRLVLIPTGGFGWMVGNREVASSSQSEAFISISADGESGVDDLVAKAQEAGATLVTPPAQQPWVMLALSPIRMDMSGK